MFHMPPLMLADHLRYIIRQEKNKDIPDEVTPKIQKRTREAILGKFNDFAKKLNAKFFNNGNEFKKASKKINCQREARGEGSIYATL